MESIMTDILAKLRAKGSITPKDIDAILRTRNKQEGGSTRAFSKKMLMPFFLKVKDNDPQLWASWGITPDEERQLLPALRLKPRRTASGVATITVITKPWPCSSNCIYCPNDLRMPKSYLHDEPACQRAERNYFDPYLQITVRLRTLMQMGHVTDKVEVIVLGGTWSDYPEDYQIWFISRLFAALNDAGDPACNQREEARVRQLYSRAGFTYDNDDLTARSAGLQQQVNQGSLSYNQAFSSLYGAGTPWESAQAWQTATWDQLEELHRANELAAHRCVGMVIETRPDNISAASLDTIRRLGCTKVQMGIQSTDPAILACNHRNTSAQQMAQAFELLRLFGFKSHAHFMANLYGSTPQQDAEDYRRFVTHPAFLPDEIKLYPCVLLEGTKLQELHRQGLWKPYDESQLVDVLVECMAATPPFTRISRMIRDFSAPDIVAGNRKTNLRQLVERTMEQQGKATGDIRHREVGSATVHAKSLRLEEVPYETTVTNEVFLQWVDSRGRIAGFLRLSLPKAEALARYEGLPIQPGEAMIREVHVYGKVAAVGKEGEGAQHLGLGKKLIARACQLAKEAGYLRINVISAIGTREYYRARGFADNGLYQQRQL